MSYIITPRENPYASLDWSDILFDHWKEKSVAEILRLKIGYEHQQRELGEFFDITIENDQQQFVHLNSGDSLLDGVGAHLKQSTIIIKGNIGHRLGFKLAGGTIVVKGNVQDYAAQGMTKGKIIIHGNCGDFLAAPLSGELSGMCGGEIHIHGDAGIFAGHRMRRGLITIKQHAGIGLASEMLAGTIIVGHTNFKKLGTGIKRGSIVSLQPQENFLIDGFKYACQYQPVWWRIYAKHLLEQQIFSLNDQLFDLQFHRYTGDSLELNKAEILLRA